MADSPIVGVWVIHPFLSDETQVSLIAFEPIGEPLGPMPDYSQMAPPAPEASPAS